MARGRAGWHWNPRTNQWYCDAHSMLEGRCATCAVPSTDPSPTPAPAVRGPVLDRGWHWNPRTNHWYCDAHSMLENQCATCTRDRMAAVAGAAEETKSETRSVGFDFSRPAGDFDPSAWSAASATAPA